MTDPELDQKVLNNALGKWINDGSSCITRLNDSENRMDADRIRIAISKILLGPLPLVLSLPKSQVPIDGEARTDGCFGIVLPPTALRSLGLQGPSSSTVSIMVPLLGQAIIDRHPAAFPEYSADGRDRVGRLPLA